MTDTLSISRRRFLIGAGGAGAALALPAASPAAAPREADPATRWAQLRRRERRLARLRRACIRRLPIGGPGSDCDAAGAPGFTPARPCLVAHSRVAWISEAEAARRRARHRAVAAAHEAVKEDLRRLEAHMEAQAGDDGGDVGRAGGG